MIKLLARPQPALLNPRLDALVLRKEEVLALGGFRRAPDLLDPRGEWLERAAVAAAVGMTVSVAALAVLFAEGRVPLAVLVVMAVVALVFAEMEEAPFAWGAGLGALGALLWLGLRLRGLEEGVGLACVGLGLGAAGAAWGLLEALRRRERRVAGMDRLERLHGAADVYNDTVRALDVFQQLAMVQGLPHDAEAEESATMLEGMHEDLVRALQAERILRENRALLGLDARISEVALSTETERVLRAVAETTGSLRERLVMARYTREALGELGGRRG